VIVYLDGYGQAYFPHVSCIITNFTHTMPADVDYVALSDSDPFYGTRVPTLSQLSVTVQPVYSRSNIAENFNVDGYASGASRQRTPTRAGFL
jgi:hypothetical protein